MRKLFPAMMLLVFCAVSASAQRTFVSVTGVDNASCSRSAPCRSFGAAVTAVAAGGEVIAIDSGGYGAFSISKGVTVLAPAGVYAGVTVASGVGISITAPGANVVLRGLVINGTGGTTGIQAVQVADLHVENVIINAMQADGIGMNSITSFLIRDSILRGNNTGLDIDASPAGLIGYVERTRFESHVSQAITFSDRTHVDFSDSTFFNNPVSMIIEPAVTTASAAIDNCVFDRGSVGIDLSLGGASGGNPAVVLGRSSFFHINDPLHRGVNPSSTYTFANNQFFSYSFSPSFDTTLTLK